MACQRTERMCECGQTFRGHTTRCAACRATERTCECGRTFRGHNRRCWPCRQMDLPAAGRNARYIARKNVRRARKNAAQVVGPVPAPVYAAILASGPCVYCGAPAAHVDHVRPLSRGGAEHPDNLAPACEWCNLSKKDRLLIEWRPDRVAYGVAHHPAVAAELAREAAAELADKATFSEDQAHVTSLAVIPGYAEPEARYSEGWHCRKCGVFNVADDPLCPCPVAGSAAGPVDTRESAWTEPGDAERAAEIEQDAAERAELAREYADEQREGGTEDGSVQQ